jgi:hypothetical protein
MARWDQATLLRDYPDSPDGLTFPLPFCHGCQRRQGFPLVGMDVLLMP